MRNINSIKEVDKSEKNGLKIPLYSSYCFSNIFGTIKNLFNIEEIHSLPKDVLPLNIEGTNKVVFFLVDAFGWSFYERVVKDSKFFCEIEKGGVVSKLTSQFPSTTTAHVTTALTGEPVFKHGLYEWFYYEPKVDNIITAFLYSGIRREGRENVKEVIQNPFEILPCKSYFGELKKCGVESIVYHPAFINDSIYTKTMCRDAKIKGYDDYSDLFQNLLIDLRKDDKKEYYYVYLPEIDSVAHEKGNDSKEFKDIMDKFTQAIDSFYENANKCLKDVAVILSADHGQIDIDLNRKNYLNHKIEGIEKYIEKNKMGEVMCPAGYCRDMFLHIKKEDLLECKEVIKREVGEFVDVYTYDELLALGIFGAGSKALRERCGNLILIPKNKENIWWFEEGEFYLSLKGVHGGASKEEMEIPLLVYKFD